MQKRSDKDHRPQIEPGKINNASNAVHHKLYVRLEEKGFGSWLSRHEILGFLTEEYSEAVEAVHSGTLDDITDELMDVAVGCIFAIACIESKSLDW